MREPIEITRISRGDRALMDDDFSKAFQCFVKDNDIMGLYRLAKFYEAKGEMKKAAEALAKAADMEDKKLDS